MKPTGGKDMQANEVIATANPEVRRRPQQIASWGHLVGFLLIGAGIVALGLLAQHAATLGQGLAFGLIHFYQGWKNVIVICVLGVLFGVLAAWRRNLRANIIVHAWADIWSGWLQLVVWR